MTNSQNGYSANDISVTEVYDIQGTKIRLRKGPPGWLLWHFGCWFDAAIRDINAGPLDDWGYAERNVRGSSDVSNHASGTALDVDSTKWPLGVKANKYLTADEINRVHTQLKIYEGCIRWGNDYDDPAYGGYKGSRTDPMHFEIDRDEATCSRVQQKLMGGIPQPNPVPQGGAANLPSVRSRARSFQAWYNAYPFKPALVPLIMPLSDNFGPQSETALKKVQSRYGLAADGIDGPQTKELLWRLGWRG